MSNGAGNPSARHCWVTGMYGRFESLPGLLLDWRRDDKGVWWGQVAYAFPAGFGSTVQVAWMEAAHLREISPPPAPPTLHP